MPRLATVAAFGFDDFDPPQTLALYRRLGCRSSQFYRNEDNPPTPADAIAICNEAGVPIDSIHGVFGVAYDPSQPDEQARRQTLDTYRREGELALGLGGPMVVVHPSPMVDGKRKPTPAERAERVAPLQRSMEELARIGEQQGIVYLIENLPGTFWIGDSPADLAGWIRQIDSPHVRMCFDTGHALISGTLDQLPDVADTIGYLHLHDNDGFKDNHLMPGDGAIDWPALGRALAGSDLDLPLMLEVFYLADKLTGCVDAGLADRFADWFALPAS